MIHVRASGPPPKRDGWGCDCRGDQRRTPPNGGLEAQNCLGGGPARTWALGALLCCRGWVLLVARRVHTEWYTPSDAGRVCVGFVSLLPFLRCAVRWCEKRDVEQRQITADTVKNAGQKAGRRLKSIFGRAARGDWVPFPSNIRALNRCRGAGWHWVMVARGRAPQM